jgi:hypothetical protein
LIGSSVEAHAIASIIKFVAGHLDNKILTRIDDWVLVWITGSRKGVDDTRTAQDIFKSPASQGDGFQAGVVELNPLLTAGRRGVDFREDNQHGFGGERDWNPQYEKTRP